MVGDMRRVCEPMSTSGTTARATGTSSDRAGAGRTGPRDVAVVGSGIVGLSTAWFLQARGVEVTVYDAEPEARPERASPSNRSSRVTVKVASSMSPGSATEPSGRIEGNP